MPCSRPLTAFFNGLLAMVEAGVFRRDLYCRIAAFTIRLPAQCERREDLQARLPGSPRLRLDPQALAALQAHDSPGEYPRVA